MFGDKRVVNNRVFLLGLDHLYRNAMKKNEVSELLPCARSIVRTLGIHVQNVPVEGYYTETQELTEYFCMVRALQGVPESSKAMVQSLPEFQRLLTVVSSPIFGQSIEEGNLLPTGQDPLSQALDDLSPNWALSSLLERAITVSNELDDYSLVGLAARIKDPVVLTATRESVVLYARMVVGSARSKPRYIWSVDKDLSEAAGRFINTFNTLFDNQMPQPKKARAEIFWQAYKSNEILGRCVRMGIDHSKTPVTYYHWAVYQDNDLMVHEFWHPETWTTERYINALNNNLCRPQL